MEAYWIKFERQSRPSPLNLGMGVTARTEADARQIVEAAVTDLSVISITPISDIGSLDKGHVVPNMGDIGQRGVWFPLGYADSRG